MRESPLHNRINAYWLTAAASGVMLAGLFSVNSAAYFCIALPAIIPIVIWFRAGAGGIPIIPLLFSMYFVYYGIPLLRLDAAEYSPDELVATGVAVGSFLAAATAALCPFLFGRGSPAAPESDGKIADRHVIAVIYVGLTSGIVYQLAIVTGNADWLGSWLGVVRSVMMTLAGLGCYLLGYGRAKGMLVGEHWVPVCCCFAFLMMCLVANLLLSGGMSLMLAAVLGYVLAKGRVPWVALMIATALFAVLHAGKFEERDKYWGTGTSPAETLSAAQIPGMILDWLATGIAVLAAGGGETDLFERASLLHMVLLVERSTPDFIPYMEGETYAVLSSTLVPRFVDPGKAASQAGLNLLSIHYGLQTEDATGRTTIAWGLIAEAYANFGYWAVIATGALFGVLCGALTWFSAGVSATSWRMIVGISATLVLADVEADFAFLIVTLIQAVVATLSVVVLSKCASVLGPRRRTLSRPGLAPVRMQSPGGRAPTP